MLTYSTVHGNSVEFELVSTEGGVFLFRGKSMEAITQQIFSNSVGQQEPATPGQDRRALIDGSQRSHETKHPDPQIDRIRRITTCLSQKDVERLFGTSKPQELYRIIAQLGQRQLQVTFRSNRGHWRLPAQAAPTLLLLTLQCDLGSCKVQGCL